MFVETPPNPQKLPRSAMFVENTSSEIFELRRSALTHHPSPLTPHPSPLTPHPSPKKLFPHSFSVLPFKMNIMLNRLGIRGK